MAAKNEATSGDGPQFSSKGEEVEALSPQTTIATPIATASVEKAAKSSPERPGASRDQNAASSLDKWNESFHSEIHSESGRVYQQGTSNNSAQEEQLLTREEKQSQERGETKGMESVGSSEHQNIPRRSNTLRLQQQQKDKQLKQLEQRQKQPEPQEQQDATADERSDRADSGLSGSTYGESPGPSTEVAIASAAEAPRTAVATDAGIGLRERRQYSIQEMMHYAVKSQRPFHPRVPGDGVHPMNLPVASTSPRQSQENLLVVNLTENCNGGADKQQRQENGEKRERSRSTSEDRMHRTLGCLEGISEASFTGRETTKDETVDGVAPQSYLQAPLRTDDYFRSCFSEPSFRLVQRQSVATDTTGAPQGPGGPRRPRMPLGLTVPGGPRQSGVAPAGPSGPVAEEIQPRPAGVVEDLSGAPKGGPQLNARRRPPRHVRSSGIATTQGSQPDEIGGQRPDETRPAWATHAHGNGASAIGGSLRGFAGDELLGAFEGGLSEADEGLAAFSMGDIRLAERAVESGMTLERYFRSVKGSGPRGSLEGSPNAELNAAYAPKALSEHPVHREQIRTEESQEGPWDPSQGSTVPPPATVGLGGVPLEHDIDEEFSFLEETDFSLAGEPREKGDLQGRSLGSSEPGKARAKAAAAAAAAHAAAAAPSNPEAASVAAWFTTILAAPPNVPSSPAGCSREPAESEVNAAPIKREVGIVNSPQSRRAQRQEGPRRQQQTSGAPSILSRGYSNSKLQQPFPLQQRMQQQQLYVQFQQQRLHTQQAMPRQHRGQPLDAAQGREAGRQLLSLIGVIPKTAAEDPNLGTNGNHSLPPQGLHPVGSVDTLRKPAPTAAADLERQLIQRHYHLPQQQHMQLQHHVQPQQQYVQQHHHRMQIPNVNPHFLPGASLSFAEIGRPTLRGFPSMGVHGLVAEPVSGHVDHQQNPHGPMLPRAWSGERNLLKLLRAGGGPQGCPADELPGPPSGQSEHAPDIEG